MYCQLFKSIRCSHTVYKYWMQQQCLYTKCFQCNQLSYTATMDASIHAPKLNASNGCKQTVDSNGCSIDFCIKKVSSSCNYCNNAKMCRHICSQTEFKYWVQTNWTSIWCSIILYIQSNSSSCNYCNKANINEGIYATKLNASFEFKYTVTLNWMQHHSLQP